ncbi:DeoR/GlpR family DNA-binding transcription regulator [Pseudoleptotrichia goodfellowii]|uniref:Transcriptional regulator, DeoR family n=1 Tax=Pseudoleptotrichia goodfellowii F0264 TaxID=596323 RepID=D0GK06_9FUSO|nr:DeoR/GlpR family DNA-binding transcription regulator [Pseudoleptotrichia goodfellowii]EEY35614.1 transcriptional regulator, DeoR family [Pseudoleptotrichia goodfellowii F0264]
MKKMIDFEKNKVYYMGAKIKMTGRENMLEIDRFEKIMQELNKKGRLSYRELDDIMEVSSSTVRRDIEKMYSKGLLLKIKGGICQQKKLSFDVEVKDRFRENVEAKKEIAERISKTLKDKDFIFLDAGTTAFYLIEKLRGKNITVVTNGTMHIEELLKYKIKTIILGGEIKESTKAVIGLEAILSLEKYRFDKCFLGVNGINLENGFTTPEINEAMIKKKVLELSEEKYILADKEKFDKMSNVKFAELEECKIVTTKQAIKENNRYKKYFY